MTTCYQCGRQIPWFTKLAGERILMPPVMLDVSDKHGRVWCFTKCQDVTMGWNTKKPYRASQPRSLKCQQCGRRFESTRGDTRWCSNRCRVRAQRKNV